MSGIGGRGRRRGIADRLYRFHVQQGYVPGLRRWRRRGLWQQKRILFLLLDSTRAARLGAGSRSPQKHDAADNAADNKALLKISDLHRETLSGRVVGLQR